MNSAFINCFAGEWIKKRRSFASWLVFAGGLFVPFITTIVFIVYPKQIMSLHTSKNFWGGLFEHSWQAMAFMLLPMGIVLAVSLITQLEFKNNCWKQLHTAPASFSSIYFSKLAVLIVMMLQLFILFNIGIYLSGIFPAIFHSEIPFPAYTINYKSIFIENGQFFVLCLPMIALQYLISLQFKNFMVPVGAGLALVVGGLIGLSWKYIYVFPPSYTALHFLQVKSTTIPTHNLVNWSLGYFIFFTIVGYWLYISKKEKG